MQARSMLFSLFDKVTPQIKYLTVDIWEACESQIWAVQRKITQTDKWKLCPGSDMFCAHFFPLLCWAETWTQECKRASFTGMFTSRYDWAWKGQNVSLSRGASKNNLEEMVGFHSGGVERKEGVRGQSRMNNQLKGNYKRYTYLQII